ncbi:MAG: SRPBCC family protein [Myxococcales bacterium]
MITALLVPLLFAAAPFDELKLEEKELARLQKGEVVVRGEVYKTAEGKNAGRGKAWVIIKKPREAVYEQLTKGYDQFPEFMPRLKKVNVISRSEDAMLVRSYVGVAFSTYEYTLKFKLDPAAFQTNWVLDKSAKNDIKDTAGEWKLLELEPGVSTLAQYSISVDSGMFVPQFLEDYMTRKDLPEILNALRKRVESDGKWKKE